MTKVAVIGAGMCGISCASYLQKNGFEVTVFEKVVVLAAGWHHVE